MTLVPALAPTRITVRKPIIHRHRVQSTIENRHKVCSHGNLAFSSRLISIFCVDFTISNAIKFAIHTLHLHLMVAIHLPFFLFLFLTFLFSIFYRNVTLNNHFSYCSIFSWPIFQVAQNQYHRRQVNRLRQRPLAQANKRI